MGKTSKAIISLWAGVLCLSWGLNALAAESSEIMIADFESEDFGDWWVSGDAFGQGPATGTLSEQNPVTGFRGNGFVNSYHNGEQGTGVMTSPPFTIERDHINFLINGGHHPLKLETNATDPSGEKAGLVYIGLGSFKHAVFDDIVVERDNPNSSVPEVLFRESFDAMGRSGGMYGLDPDVWNVGADDGDAVPWPPPAGTIQPGSCYSRLWDLGGGDWCFFDRNGDFNERRLMNGIRSVQGFSRGNNLRITFKTWGRTDMGGEPYPQAAGIHGPWHAANQWEWLITNQRATKSLEHDIEAGLAFWPGWKHRWEEHGGGPDEGVRVENPGPYINAALKAYDLARPTDLRAGKAHALTVRVWLGNESGGKLEFSADGGATWGSLTDEGGNAIDTRDLEQDGIAPNTCCINLLIDDEVQRTASGVNWAAQDDGRLSWYTWDVKNLRGKTAQIQIIDTHTGTTQGLVHLYNMWGQGTDPLPWGYINVDQIVQSDRRRFPVYANAGVEIAMRNVDSLARRGIGTSKDRLTFHFKPPAWSNGDPDGPFYFKGYYHMFYQYNPDSYGFGYKHWGHARSKDLVYWEHLPIALWPSREIGEKHCYSGNTIINDDGVPMAFYASIGTKYGSNIGIAMPTDDELIGWEKHPATPFGPKSVGTLKEGDYAIISDPFVFKEAGQWYMVLGARKEGGKACISLYKSDNFVDWEFIGIPLVGEGPKHWEVATLFKLDDKWVVTYAPQGVCRYYTGTMDFENCKFEPEYHGYLDYSGAYGFDHKIHGHQDYRGTVYAPYVAEVDHLGRRLFWMTTGGGLSLPRVFRVRPDGRLSQQPPPELKKLRGEHYEDWNVALADSSHVVQDARGRGDTIEIIAEFEPGDASVYGLKIRRSPDGESFAPITYDGRFLIVGDKKAEVDLLDGEDTLRLHVFIDKSLVEVFANDWVVFSNNIGAAATNIGVEAFASGGSANLKALDIWQLKTIW